MNSRLNKMNSHDNKENHSGKTNSANSLGAGLSHFKQFFFLRIVTVCDLGSGARCLISSQCSFEPSCVGCTINYAGCFIVHIANFM